MYKGKNDEKELEFLKGILLSTKGLETWNKPSEKIYIPESLPDNTLAEKARNSGFNSYQFNYDLSNDKSNLLFNITISKSKSKLVGIFNRKHRYVIDINIKKKNGYSNYSLDTLCFDSFNDNYDLPVKYVEYQKEIFDILMKKHEEFQLEHENKKINSYIDEIKKTTSKDIERDEKLNTLLK